MLRVLTKKLNLKIASSLFFTVGISLIILITTFNSLYHNRVVTITQSVVQQMTQESKASDGDAIVVPAPSILPAAIITAVLCLVFIMAVMGLLFHRSVLTPLRDIATRLQASATNENTDLTFRFNNSREDEIGILTDAFDIFIASIDKLVMTIGSQTETIASVSSEVLINSEQMDEESTDLYTRSNSVAAAAEEMNTSMHTIAAASEEASTNISVMADASAQMQTSITEVAKNCDEAGKISGDTKKQVDIASGKVSRLGEAAQEINQVTEAITDIAEQTNLLALNATIEAARAGEAGKGFAVVAEEIKNLASQTGASTQTIREKIQGIQASTDETINEVGTIAKVITQLDDIVGTIVKAIDEQSQQATEVAGNIEQASIGIAEVNENVAQSSQVASEIAADIANVDNVAADMSSRSETMSRGAHDLDRLSGELRKQLALFKVSLPKAEDNHQSAAAQSNIPDLLPWSDKMATTITEIDDQHKKLVAMVNQLHKSMRQQKGAARIKAILGELADYTVKHFEAEERLFEKSDYPKTDQHKKMHKDLVNKVVAFQNDLISGKADVTMELMDFLKDWLKNHIMKTDMGYVPHLKDKKGHTN